MAAELLGGRKRVRIAYEDERATSALAFDDVACFTAAGDNCAIATRHLRADDRLLLRRGCDVTVIVIMSEVPVGHRFAVDPLQPGEALTFGGEVFGHTNMPVAAGEHLCNAKALDTLRAHAAEMGRVRATPNFVDAALPPLDRVHAAPQHAEPPEQVARIPGEHSFPAFAREDGREPGTRNWVAVLPLCSQLNAFAAAVARGADGAAARAAAARGEAWDGCDGVVALEHTEGSQPDRPPNAEHVLRALRGLAAHPNVGGLVVCAPAAGTGGWLRWATLLGAQRGEAGAERARRARFEAADHDALLRARPFARVTLSGDGRASTDGAAAPGSGGKGRRWHVVFVGGGADEADAHASAAWSWEDGLAAAVRAAEEAVRAASADVRTAQPLSALRVAQQCGGSDAFSGVTANPLLGAACRELIARGGSALIAETDELIGAESSILAKVASAAVVSEFSALVARFRAYAEARGCSAEGNPSAGNLLRGIYNLTLKSLGAARKRHPDVRLDACLEYAEPMPTRARARGGTAHSTSCGDGVGVGGGSAGVGADGGGSGFYCFMDSPGNDLESIGGQLAAGCTLVAFTTGNGSMANAPLAPTLKVVSSSAKFRKMAAELDFDAGRLASSGLSEAELARELFELMVRVAGGERTKGERAGHCQLQLWRAWAPLHNGEGGGAEGGGASAPESDELGRSGCGDAGGAGAIGGPPGRGGADRSPAGRAESEDEQLAASELAAAAAVAPALRFGAFGSVPRQAPAAAEPVGRAGGAQLALDRVALIVPTSLCAAAACAQLSAQLSARFAAALRAPGSPVRRVVALAHTEGCGVSEHALSTALLCAHAAHPSVAAALFVEHGCEWTHNAHYARELRERGAVRAPVTFASLQRGGGVQPLRDTAAAWLAAVLGVAGAEGSDGAGGRARAPAAQEAGGPAELRAPPGRTPAAAAEDGCAHAPAPAGTAAAVPRCAVLPAGLAQLAVGFVALGSARQWRRTDACVRLLTATAAAAAQLVAGGGTALVLAGCPLGAHPLLTPGLRAAVRQRGHAGGARSSALRFGDGPGASGVYSLEPPHAELTPTEHLVGLAAAGASLLLLLSPSGAALAHAQAHPLVPTLTAAALGAAGDADLVLCPADDAPLAQRAVGAVASAVASGAAPCEAPRAHGTARGPDNGRPHAPGSAGRAAAAARPAAPRILELLASHAGRAAAEWQREGGTGRAGVALAGGAGSAAGPTASGAHGGGQRVLPSPRAPPLLHSQGREHFQLPRTRLAVSL